MNNEKQIIIDGVDVSECPDLLKEYLPSCYCSVLDKENQEASCAGCFCLFKIKQYMNNNKLIEDLKYELESKTQECEKYEQALDDIEEAFEYDIEYGSGLHRQVLDIINKAKGSNYCI